MSEKCYNFDERLERRNTGCLKYDFARERGKPEGVLPLWVADMDFQVPDEVRDDILKRVSHGIFGYSEAKDAYFEAVRAWMEREHSWSVEKRWLVRTPGVVFALAMAVRAFTKPGDRVMIQQPVYYPFSEVIKNNGREIVNNSLVLSEDGVYRMDLWDFEKKAVEHRVKLFLLCNPHNPVGRVYTREELEQLGEICIRHNILVVSDEIHQDFVYEKKHHVFATIGEALKNRSIICTAPSKTFNLAGLQASNIFIPNGEIRKRFKKEIIASGYGQLNTLGLVACESAYLHGKKWHSELMDYLKENLSFVREYLKEHLPEIKLIEPEGTYLIWLDFRGLNVTEEEREELIVNKAGLWLDSGMMFGSAGEGFERINIACPRSTLKLAFDKLKSAVDDLKK